MCAEKTRPPVDGRIPIAILGRRFGATRKAPTPKSSRSPGVRLGALNPVRGLDFGERAGKRAQVPLGQVEAVRALASERIRVAIDLAVSTGQRRGDLLTLRRSQLTDEGVLFRQSKTGADVLIEWSNDLHAIVERAKQLTPQIPAEYLIRTQHGKPYTARLLGYLATPHDQTRKSWRHTIPLPRPARGERGRRRNSRGSACPARPCEHRDHAAALLPRRHESEAATLKYSESHRIFRDPRWAPAIYWRARTDSNRRPPGSKPGALSN